MSFLLTDYRIRLASLPQLSNSFHHNYLTDTSVLIRTCLMWSQSRLSHWPISVLFTNVTLVELQSHFLPFICWWYTAVLFLSSLTTWTASPTSGDASLSVKKYGCPQISSHFNSGKIEVFYDQSWKLLCGAHSGVISYHLLRTLVSQLLS